MPVAVLIQYEGGNRVEIFKKEFAVPSIPVWNLKQIISLEMGIDVPCECLFLYDVNQFEAVAPLANDHIIDPNGTHNLLSMVIPMPHVAFEFQLPGGEIVRGEMYMETETISVSNIESELRRRYLLQLPSFDVIIQIFGKSDHTEQIPPEHEFKREGSRIFARTDTVRTENTSTPMIRPFHEEHSGLRLRMSLIHSCEWLDDFFEIPKNIAHSVFEVDDEIVLYRRSAIDELYSDLFCRDRAVLKGPAGCGKSTSVFAEALSLAKKEKHRILWIKADSGEFLLFRDSSIEQYFLETESWDPLRQLLKCAFISIDFIIVDQCRMNHGSVSKLIHSLRYQWLSAGASRRRLYVITSDGTNDLKCCGFQVKDLLELAPWTFDEFLLVIKNANALKKFAKSLGVSEISPDEIHAKARLKFHYAGISARFFFDYTIPEIKKTVDFSIAKVTSFNGFFNGDSGMASPEAVNVLFHQERRSIKFSSRFIADRLIEDRKVLPQTFTEMVNKLGSNPNRSGVGVMFELYTLCLISRFDWDPLVPVSNAFDRGCPYELPAISRHVSNRPLYHYKSGSDEPIKLGYWYKPFKPSNPGFDAFYAFGKQMSDGTMLEDLVIVFVQVTCGKEHECNPQHFAKAAVSVCRRIPGYAPQADRGPTRRSKLRTNVTSFKHTKLFIEILFAIPRGRKGNFVIKQTDVLDYLENLDERWNKPTFVEAEVPDSDAYLETDNADDSSDWGYSEREHFQC